jgi:hypothetical protein
VVVLHGSGFQPNETLTIDTASGPEGGKQKATATPDANSDVRTAEYFLQLTCALLGFLLLGVSTGCLIPVLLRAWRSHKGSRLTDECLSQR